VKKTDRIARELEQSVSTGVENAKDWAAPRVEAAVNWAVPRLQQGLDSASPKIQEGLKSAAHNLADGVATVTPRLQDGLAQLAPKIHDAVEGATPRLQEALNKATPAIANARDRVVVEYLPRLSDQIGYASEAVHRTLESAPGHVDAVAQKLGDVGIIHAVQEQTKDAGSQIKFAANGASKAVGYELAKPQKPKHRGLLILGVVAAAFAAGVAAWKASKPIEDPWKTPSPVTPAPVLASTVNEVKDATEDIADKTGAAAVTAADGAAGTNDVGSATAAAEDSKEATAKVATDAKTAVRNIAASSNHKADTTADKSEADKPTGQ
jgi:hypothetical protein